MDARLFYLLYAFAHKSRLLDLIVIFCANYLAYVLAAAFFAFLIWSHRGDAEEKIRIFLTALAAIILSRLVLTEGIRFLYPRVRPFDAFPNVQSLIAESGRSFPSGHAAFFFALSAVLYFYNKRWGVWFFGTSIVIGLARIAAGVHYPSDIAGGALVGLVSGYFVFRIAEALRKKQE